MIIITMEKPIVAISTPLGRGAISIVRMSGKNSLQIALKFFHCKDKVIKPRYMYFGRLEMEKDTFEECLMVYFKAPFSYTGEDLKQYSDVQSVTEPSVSKEQLDIIDRLSRETNTPIKAINDYCLNKFQCPLVKTYNSQANEVIKFLEQKAAHGNIQHMGHRFRRTAPFRTHPGMDARIHPATLLSGRTLDRPVGHPVSGHPRRHIAVSLDPSLGKYRTSALLSAPRPRHPAA